VGTCRSDAKGGTPVNIREIIDPNLLLFKISGSLEQSVKITHLYNGKVIHLILDIADDAIR